MFAAPFVAFPVLGETEGIVVVYFEPHNVIPAIRSVEFVISFK